MPKPPAAGQHEPAGAITVHVVDDAGKPMAGADVRALEVNGEGVHRKVVRARSTAINVSRGWEKKTFLTDDRGDVRIYGLPPADYLVVVAERGPIYFPGSMSRADARAISIREWDDVSLEIALARPGLAQISGRVVRWDGEPGRMSVVLERNHQGPLYRSGFVDDTIDTAELVDGAFTFHNVLPGDYVIRTLYDPDPALHDGFGAVAITLDTEDVSDVVLKTSRRR
jgi:hypothetical protein